MDLTTRCFHCGKRMVAVMSMSGRTELHCVRCDDVEQISLVPAMITKGFQNKGFEAAPLVPAQRPEPSAA